MKLFMFLSVALMSLSGMVHAQSTAEPKKWNISTNPFRYFFGDFNANVQYALHDHITVGFSPFYTYAYRFEPAVHGFGGRVSVAAYFDKVYEGFHLDAGMAYQRLSQDATVGGSNSENVYCPDFLTSWAWLWDSGFNAFVGIGLGYYFGGGEIFVGEKLDYDGVGFSGKFGFGYAF